MPTYEVTDQLTGKRYELTGDSPPTEQELAEMFPDRRQAIPEKSLLQKAGDVALGTVETAASIATGIPASVMGLLGGIAKTFTTGDEAGKKTREDITEAFTYAPKTESGKGAVGIFSKILSPLTYPRQIATKLGGEQYGNVADVSMIGLAPKVPSAIKTVRNVPYKAGEWLYGKQLNPKGTLEEATAKSQTGFERGYETTPSGWEKFKKDLAIPERQRQQLLAQHEGLTVPFNDIITPLNNLEKNYAGYTSKPTTNRKAVQAVRTQMEKEWLTKYPDGQIPLTEVQKFKETLYKRNESAYGEIKKAMTAETEKALARGARKGIEEVLPELGVVNRQFKPLLEFYDDFEKSVREHKYGNFSWTDTVFNNTFLINKLARVFRAISPKHPLGNPKTLSNTMLNRMIQEYPADFNDTSAIAPISPRQIVYEDMRAKPVSGVRSHEFETGEPYTGQRPARGIPYTEKPQIGYDKEPLIRGRFEPSDWRKQPAGQSRDIVGVVGEGTGKLQIPLKDLKEQAVKIEVILDKAKRNPAMVKKYSAMKKRLDAEIARQESLKGQDPFGLRGGE